MTKPWLTNSHPVPEGYKGPESINADFSIEYVDQCGPGGGGSAQLLTANVDDVIVCFNFLVALGNYQITVSDSDQINGLPGFRQVAIYNSAIVVAHKLNVPSTSSTAYDVALGVQWVFTNCNNGGQVAGEFSHRHPQPDMYVALLTRENRHRIGCCVRQW